MNFLQAHYNQFRKAGGDHHMYVAWNDISDEEGAKLKDRYENHGGTEHPDHKKERQRFWRHLTRNSHEVNRWPCWKQDKANPKYCTDLHCSLCMPWRKAHPKAAKMHMLRALRRRRLENFLEGKRIARQVKAVASGSKR